jgi:hypothetical protein
MQQGDMREMPTGYTSIRIGRESEPPLHEVPGE